MASEPRIIRNDARSCFELSVDGRVVGRADYRIDGDRMLFPHTEVDAALNGQGLGSVLARAAFDAAKADGMRIVPQCSFMALYARRHPEDYAAFVDPR
jgi:predicted GNAT family acetyltransferase